MDVLDARAEFLRPRSLSAGSARGRTLSSEMSPNAAGRSMITEILRAYGTRSYHEKNNYHENGARRPGDRAGYAASGRRNAKSTALGLPTT